MQIQGEDRHWHLTYCGNVHPVDSFAGLRRALRAHLPPLIARIDPERRRGPFAVGLYFGAAAARSLAAEPEQCRELARELDEMGAHALTANAFPHGDFHAAAVKHAVYLPDWTSPDRLDYTIDVARVMAQLPSAAPGQSISTLPGAYGPASADALERMSANLGLAARELGRIEAETGRRIALAIEPEPGCCFQTTDEIIAFLDGRVLAGPEEALRRRHLGVCFDVCHQAVEFEDPGRSLERLAAHGIAVPKIQLSTAIEIAEPGRAEEARRELASFDEARYLHQVVAKDRRGGLCFFDDLGDFLEVAEERDDLIARCHFHVPIFRSSYGALRSTQAELRALLDTVQKKGIDSHLEIETYSWGVLPERRGKGSVPEDLLKDLEGELRWVIERFEGQDPARDH